MKLSRLGASSNIDLYDGPHYCASFIVGRKGTVLARLRLVTSGSAPLSIHAHQKFQSIFGRHIVERYGMTEVGIVLSNPYPSGQRAGTVGFPLGQMQFKIVDEMEMNVKLVKWVNC